MKYFFALLFSISCTYTNAQKTLQLIDISKPQLSVLKMLENYPKLDSSSRSKVLIDSIYIPYKTFWNGYLGNGNDVAEFMDVQRKHIPQIQRQNKLVDLKELEQQFKQILKKMSRMTGYHPKGIWYIVYGPAWTDLGGLGDYAMLIDLAHQSNSSNERIAKMLPHEFTHQIMVNVNQHKDTTAINSIIGEGFAVWMNQKYWEQKYTLAENLGYTDAELQICNENIEKLKTFFLKNKYSSDKEVINLFRNRGAKLNEKLPGAIGYYIGYKIIEAYVNKYGANSWRDVFIKSPKDIYELSGFTN